MVDEVRPRCTGTAGGAIPRDRRLARPRSTARRRRRCRRSTGKAGSLDNDQPINIQYTSGTTGFPKGATLSHRNILNNGFFATELINFGPDDRLCIPVPFYHCFGMVLGNLGCTSHGATMVIPAPAFDPALTLDAIEKERCTGVYGVPTMFIAMLGEPDSRQRDLSSLRTGIMAGSICPVEVMKRCVNEMNMTEVAIAYGMTETSPVSCQTLIDDDLERRTAYYRPGPPARRDQDRRRRNRRGRRTRSDRRILHARLLGDARLLGGRGQDARGDRR